MPSMTEREKIHRLFKDFERGGFAARNRFVRAATWLGCCAHETGELTQAAVSRTAEAAAGGAGTVCHGAGRERRITSAIHSGKVLGGLGASFKKPPTFPRFSAPLNYSRTEAPAERRRRLASAMSAGEGIQSGRETSGRPRRRDLEPAKAW